MPCGAAAAVPRAEYVMGYVRDRDIAMLNQLGWLARRQKPTTAINDLKISGCIARK
jgi:hypothetical protein